MKTNTFLIVLLAPAISLAYGPIGPADFGDLPDGTVVGAPVTYRTRIADGGPWHLIGKPIQIGAKPDAEADGQADIDASGDDLNFSPDEDGMSIPAAIRAGEPTVINGVVTNQTATPVYFHAFIDWNGDGQFAGPAETLVQVVPPMVINHPIVLNYNVPFTSETGYRVGARFRISSLALDPDDIAPDGEIEDYLISIKPGKFDFGDLPAPDDFSPGYPTLIVDNGPYHVIDDRLHLGITPADAETDGLPSAAAKGDDATATNDEDYFTPISNLQAGTTTTFTQVVTNDTGALAYLHTFIDWNGDFDFLDASEYTRTPVPDGMINAPLSYTIAIPHGLPYLAPVAARARLSSLKTLGPGGFAPDGEVEDTFVTVKPLLDWGDLSDFTAGSRAGSFDTSCLPDYRTLASDNGPSHIIIDGLSIHNDSGSGDADIDGEADGQPTNAADGDDLDGNNDDLILLIALTSQTFNVASPVEHSTITIDIATSQAVTNTTGNDATFYAFLDGNRDGDFDDPGETQTAVIPGDGSMISQSSTHTITIPWPGDLEWSETFAMRFRISSDPSLDANGPAPDGEVQDHLITFSFSISDPRPVLETIPSVYDVPNTTVLTSVQHPYELTSALPVDLGPYEDLVWSINGVLLEGEAPVLDQEALAALGQGAHPVVVTFTLPGGARGVARFSLIVSNEPTYEAWINLHGLAGEDALHDQDVDGDGRSNLEEFALGSIPVLAADLPPYHLTFDGTHQLYSYLRRAGGVTVVDGSYHADGIRYVTPTSVDLTDWSTLANQDVNPAGLPAAPANYEWVTFQLPSGSKGFIRVEYEVCN